jgi:hypothetical protein
MKSRHQRAGVRGLVYVLILTTTMVCSINPDGWSMLVPAEMPAAAAGSTRAADMKTIQGTLESKILRERLKELGLTDAEIESRLSKLSDKEVHQFATRIQAVNPGGNVTVIGILVGIVLVLVIIYLIKKL